MRESWLRGRKGIVHNRYDKEKSVVLEGKKKDYQKQGYDDDDDDYE